MMGYFWINILLAKYVIKLEMGVFEYKRSVFDSANCSNDLDFERQIFECKPAVFVS